MDGVAVTYQLHRLITELDDRTATSNVDCAPATICNGLLTISDGKVGPQNAAQVPNWIHLIRVAAQQTQGGLSFLPATVRAYESPLIRHEFDKVNLPHPFVEYKANFGWAHTYHRLEAGWVAHLPILYGVINREGHAPSGSLSFMGGHSILMANYHKTKHGWLHYDIADPLMDGRVRWVNGRIHRYPSGWQRVRAQFYRDAAGAWGNSPVGAGHVYAIFVKPRS